MEGQLNLFDYVRDDVKHVEAIDKSIAKPFIENIHYSRKLPQNTIYAFGLFENKELIGVVTYGIPASPSLCKGVAGKENFKNVIELNRLALMDDKHGNNNASFLVAKSLKMLPNCTYVVSYADTGWGHVGYVYQSCNFIYTGLSAKRVDTFSNGKHPRTTSTSKETRHQTRNRKHRYIYCVGDKRTKKQMIKQIKYPIYPTYPKGETHRYDTKNPQIVVPIEIIDDTKE